MAERGWAFLARAGTLIFAVTIVVWALAYYPRSNERVAADVAAQRADASRRRRSSCRKRCPCRGQQELAEFDDPENWIISRPVCTARYSFLGRAGQWIEPAVRPLGWDWRIGCAAIASFPAREVVMGVLGVIYNLGPDVDVGDESDQNRLRQQLRAARWDDTGEPVYNLPVALSIMVFFALCAQCARDAGRDPPRNQQLALAACLRLRT